MKRVNFKMKENIKFLILYSSVFKGISYAKMEFIFFFIIHTKKYFLMEFSCERLPMQLKNEMIMI